MVAVAVAAAKKQYSQGSRALPLLERCNMNSCNRNCNTLCPNFIISTAVTVITINGTDTLVIDIPAGTYKNGCKYCIVIAQTIPSTATINMPVAISVGGVTTTVYPLTNMCCAQVTACAIRTRKKYPTCVSTSAAGGIFKVLGGLSCAPNNALVSLPVPTTATPASVTEAATVLAAQRKSKSIKEVSVNE